MRKQILTAAVVAACAGVSVAAMADETTKVGGKAYIDITNIDQKDNGTKADSSGIGADLKRFYLSVDHGFDDMWSANLTTDVNSYNSSTKATTLYVKKAYLQGKFADAAVLRAGSADMPWIPYAEDAYGYRYVEKTLIDRLGFGTSADWGAHIGGKVMDGMLNYAVSVVNGNGYKNPTRSKSMDFEGRVGVMPVKGLNLAVGFYNGKLGKNTESNAANPAVSINTANRVNVLAAYSYTMFNVGAEYFTAKNWAVTSTDKADGFSVYGSVKPIEQVAVFARYDQAKPSKTNNSSLKDTYYNVGVAYTARKNVDLALVYKNEKVAGTGTINGITGGSTGDGKYSEIGVFTQVKF
jgi:Gram-negative porin